MPEGHTLFRLGADLSAAFGGQVVEVTSPQGRFVEDAALVDGQVLESADSAGKHLFIHFLPDPDGAAASPVEPDPGALSVIHVHLGLIGVFSIEEGPAPEPVGAVRLRLVGPSAYADLRGATTCELISAETEQKILAKLGPDPLRPDADPSKAFARIHKSTKSIGALLMDQSVLAGVGLRLSPQRYAVPRLRLHDQDEGARRAQPVLVPDVSAEAVAMARRASALSTGLEVQSRPVGRLVTL